MEEHRINIMEDAPSKVEQEQAAFQPQVAGITERFIALLIDFGLVNTVYQLLAAFYIKHASLDLEQIYLVFAGVIIPFILYETFFTCGGRSTLGKLLVGIRVENVQTGQPLSLWRAFVRAVGYFISAALLMCGFLLAFIDTRHRALHDYLAGSEVMQARPKGWLEKTVLSVTGFVLMALFMSYFYSQIFSGGSMAQKQLINRAQNHLEKIGYLEEIHRVYFGYYTNDLLRLSILSGDPVQFQRDTHKVLHNRDFRIGVSEKGYKIQARAKDINKTRVSYP